MQHKLLLRQLKRLGLSEEKLPANQEEWTQFLGKVSNAYNDADQERFLMERSINISSIEMQDRWEKINKLLEKNEKFLTELEGHNEALKQIVDGQSPETILQTLGESLIDLLECSGCSVYIVDEENPGHMQGILSHNLPESLSQNASVIPIGEKIGTCGKAAFLKAPVYTEDIMNEPNWVDFKGLVEGSGLHSCWSYPIISNDGQLYGTFALYSKDIKLPCDLDKKAMENVSKLAIILMDIKRSQDKLEEEQIRAISSSKKAALGEMAGGIAHEINNPLAIIKGNTLKLKILSDRGKVTPDDVLDVSNKVSQTVDRISKIIKALKVYSRDDSKIEKEHHNILEIVDDSLALCAEKIKNSGVNLEVKIDDGLLPVYANEIQLSQVFVNLISNAYDAVLGTKDPWIRVEVKSCREKVQLLFTDSGYGIPPELQEKIMQPFFTTKEVGKGTGVGLSLSQGLIRDNGGELRYCSNSENTQFVVELPLVTLRSSELNKLAG